MNDSHHWGWLIFAFFCVGLVAWIYSSNRPNTDNYGKDSTHNEQNRQDWPFSFHIGEGGCATLSAMRSLEKKISPKSMEVNK